MKPLCGGGTPYSRCERANTGRAATQARWSCGPLAAISTWTTTAVVQTTHLAGADGGSLANPGSILLTSSLGARRRFRRREAIGPPAGQGPGRPSADLRGDGRGPGEDTFAGYCSARSHAIRRPRRRTGAIHRTQQLAANGLGQIVAIVGEGGGRQVALIHESIHAPLSAGLAGRQGRIGLLRQADGPTCR